MGLRVAAQTQAPRPEPRAGGGEARTRYSREATTSAPCRYKPHPVWDNCEDRARLCGYAAKLCAEILDEDRVLWMPPTIDIAGVVAWANECSAIAERPHVQYCVQVADSCWYAWDA